MSLFSDVSFIKSAAAIDGFPPDVGAEIAFAGRSNAGKSSALNAITGRRSLARTSKTPGRTQLINFFTAGTDRRLVDLPGYGFAKVPDTVRAAWHRLMQDYFDVRASLAGLIIVVDVRRGVSAMDLEMFALAARSARPVHVLLTKADKLKRGAAARSFHQTQQALPAGAGLQLFSSLTKDGVDEAREVLAEILAADEAKSPGAD